MYFSFCYQWTIIRVYKAVVTNEELQQERTMLFILLNIAVFLYEDFMSQLFPYKVPVGKFLC